MDITFSIKEISLCIQVSTDYNLLLSGTRDNRWDSKAVVQNNNRAIVHNNKTLRIDKTGGVPVMIGK